MARSDITHMIMCIDSGISEMKSQNVSCAEAACGISLCGSGFTAWIRSGNLIASWMKKTGMLLPTRSKLPSCGVELDGEAAHVAREVARAARAGHRREAHEDRRLRSDGILKELGLGVPRHRLVDLEVAVGGRAARMHHALGNPLVIEVGDLLAEDEVLEQRRPALAGLQRVLIVVDPEPLVRREMLAVRAHAKLLERLLLRARARSLGRSRVLLGFTLRHLSASFRVRNLGRPMLPIQRLCQTAPGARQVGDRAIGRRSY